MPLLVHGHPVKRWLFVAGPHVQVMQVKHVHDAHAALSEVDPAVDLEHEV